MPMWVPRPRQAPSSNWRRCDSRTFHPGKLSLSGGIIDRRHRPVETAAESRRSISTDYHQLSDRSWRDRTFTTKPDPDFPKAALQPHMNKGLKRASARECVKWVKAALLE